MRKLILAVFLILMLPLWGISADFSVNLNINYNHGISDFFEESQLHLSYSGLNFIEKRQNQLGLGFNLSFNIPILKRFYLVPGVCLYFGHQSYEYTQVEVVGTGENDVKNTFYFKLYSGEMNLQYDLLVLKNGWYVSLLLGLNYNYLKADSEMMMDDEKYWGMLSGLSARFLQLKHLGFHVSGYYKIPFDAKFCSFIGAQAGISYRF